MSWRPARSCLILFFGLALLGQPLIAQSKQKEPKRPRLAEGVDSNSAMSYFQLGHSSLEKDVDRAADAFYWASRLDPAWAAPVYGLYAALLLTGPVTDLNLYMTDREKALSYKRIATIDSMSYAAELRNPFVDRRLYATLVNTWIKRVYGEDNDIRDLGRFDKRYTAWAAYARGNYEMSTRIYRDELKKNPDDINLHFAQARNFFVQGMYDSSRVMVQRAMVMIREREANAPAVGWVPHAYGEYMMGFLFRVTEQWDSAGAAYERSLLDDIAFHPAHAELARVRLLSRDTAAALHEFTEAVTLAPHDAFYLYELGVLLAQTGQADSAAKMLKRSIEQEPYYASPYLPLGMLMEGAGFKDESIGYYQKFLALAPKNMTGAINAVQARLTRLKGS